MFDNKATDIEEYDVYLWKKYSISGELWNTCIILLQV